MELSKNIVFFFAILCVNHSGATLIQDNIEFSYNTSAPNGPQHWGDINKEWALCKTGLRQSPIAIEDQHVILVQQSAAYHDLQWSYHPNIAVLKNHGYNIVIEWNEEVGAVLINETEFPLKQVHWHIPSENKINGHSYSLEAHMLHVRAIDNRMAMIALLYTIGDPDPFFAKIESQIRFISRKMGAEVDIGNVNPIEIRRDIGKYYRFQGSITTPPCTEGVTWTVSRQFRTISTEQLRLLQDAVDPEYVKNARPQQPTNGRVVQLYG